MTKIEGNGGFDTGAWSAAAFFSLDSAAQKQSSPSPAPKSAASSSTPASPPSSSAESGKQKQPSAGTRLKLVSLEALLKAHPEIGKQLQRAAPEFYAIFGNEHERYVAIASLGNLPRINVIADPKDPKHKHLLLLESKKKAEGSLQLFAERFAAELAADTVRREAQKQQENVLARFDRRVVILFVQRGCRCAEMDPNLTCSPLFQTGRRARRA